MQALDDGTLVEGMYSDAPEDVETGYLMPKAHRTPWFGQRKFETRLKRAQKDADHIDAHGAPNYCFLERTKEGRSTPIGSGWYRRRLANGVTVEWLDGLLHYVANHNVIPSQEFVKLLAELYP